MNELLFITVFAGSYLLGSIPFGLLLTKWAGLGDIRTIGSGNIGATNVLRTGNRKLAALTLFLDALKGAATVVICFVIDPNLIPYAALATFLGHLYPVWLKGKGGKGVATAIGIVTALCWPLGLMVMATWLLVAKTFRYSSLAALIALGLAPLYAIFVDPTDNIGILLIMAALILWKHRENIERLLNGAEPKIGTPSKEE